MTKNKFGAGKAYYVATCPEDAFLEAFLKKVTDEAVNVSLVQHRGTELITQIDLSGQLQLAAKGVAIIQLH